MSSELRPPQGFCFCFDFGHIWFHISLAKNKQSLWNLQQRARARKIIQHDDWSSTHHTFCNGEAQSIQCLNIPFGCHSLTLHVKVVHFTQHCIFGFSFDTTKHLYFIAKNINKDIGTWNRLWELQSTTIWLASQPSWACQVIKFLAGGAQSSLECLEINFHWSLHENSRGFLDLVS